MKAGIVLLVMFALGGCASAPPVRDFDRLFEDAAFGAPPELPGRDDVFAVSESMHRYLRTEFAQYSNSRSPRHALHEALRTQLKLEYDTAVTRTASEAFDARAGNCLSLVVLAGTLAQALEIPVVYQEIRGYETWSRSDGIAFLSGHVNLVLGAPAPAQHFVAVIADRPLVIDFVEDARATERHARPISESTIVAMFMNNRAAEAIAAGDVEHAYWLARTAIVTAPAFLSAYNTLAVVYMRHGKLRAAERALDYALQREPANPQMLSNLARVLWAEGRSADAQRILRELAEASRYPPFYFLDRGNEALAAGDVGRALEFFRKELKRIPYDHELHFAIAIANLRRGDVEEAREHMTLAMQNSTSRDRKDIYAAKLSRLNATVH